MLKWMLVVGIIINVIGQADTICNDQRSIISRGGCNDGYFLQSLVCCKCVSGCKTCISSSACQICQDGYYLNSDNCYSCPSQCQTCTGCQSDEKYCTDAKCLTCPNKYYVFGYGCSQCSTGEAFTSPLSCKDTFFNNNGCCQYCSYQCLQCTSYENCSQCNEGYYKDSSYCNKCRTGCTLCTDGNICTSCEDGYYLSENTCMQCNSLCSTCQNSGSCSTCKISNVLPNYCCLENQYYNVDGSGNWNCSQCTSPCDQCINQLECINCISTFQYDSTNKKCVCQSNQYQSANPISCENCGYQCLTCSNSSTCSTCNSSAYRELQYNQCNCIDGYFESDKKCFQCAQPCNTCKNNQNECLTCIDLNQHIENQICICDDGYTFDLNNIYCLECVQPCTQCSTSVNNCTKCYDKHHIIQDGTCICQEGWMNASQIACKQCNQQCKTCSIDINQCDSCPDINQYINNLNQCICIDTYYSDSIRTCKQCELPCLTCNNQGCLSCIDNDTQEINQLFQCQCKQGYLQNDIYCEQCLLPCQTCQNNIDQCLSCIDINQIIIDYQCICKDGYFMKNNECYLCNDNESSCIFKCSNGCIKCNSNEQCQQCDDQYYLNELTLKCNLLNDDEQSEEEQQNNYCNENEELINGICINLCGNGILKSEYEECDDGNLLGGDGCSQLCQIEDSFQCNNIENSLSICTFIQNPQFILTNLSDKKSQIQIVQLTFNQNIKLIENYTLDQFIEFTIQPNTTLTNIQLFSIQNISMEQLSNPIYNIQIEFIESIDQPQLNVQFLQSYLVNQFNLSLQTLKGTQSLGQPYILSKTTQETVNSVVQLNNAMMYSTIGISSFALLSGNIIMFTTMLDILQQLSYLKYMKCEFPPHLTQFLQVYTKISLKPLMDMLNVDYYLLKFKNLLQFQSNSNNNNQTTQIIDPLNTQFIFNAKSCYIALLISIFTYQLSKIITSNNIQIKVLKFINRRNEFEQKQKYYYIFRKFSLAFYQQRIRFFNSGLLQVFQSIQHQFLFSIFLQFPNYSFNSIFDAFNSINAILGLIVFIKIMFISFKVTNKEYKNQQEWKYYYEQINNKFWQIKYKAFYFIKVTSYLFIIVFVIDYPNAQSFLLSLQTNMFLLYLIIKSPMNQTFDYLKLIFREIFFLLATGSFFAYSFQLNDNLYTLFGWIHIILLSMILASSLFIDIVKQIYDFIQNNKQNKVEQQRQLDIFYQTNQLQEFINGSQEIQRRKNYFKQLKKQSRQLNKS